MSTTRISTRRRTVLTVGAALAITLSVPAGAAMSSASPEQDDAATEQEFTPLGFGPKNVIVLVSDGMGYNHVDLASLWQHGTAAHQVRVSADTGEIERIEGHTSQVYEDFPTIVGMDTYPAGGGYDADEAWSDFDYVNNGFTDSAAAGTALASGERTFNGAIGIDEDGMPIKNLTERAEELGKATGVVSSVPYSHATPAAYVAHNPNRNAYQQLAQEMLFEHDLNVVMAPGHPYYDDDGQELAEPSFGYISQSTWASAVDGAGGWEFIEEADDFTELANQRVDVPERVFGVPQVASTLQFNRSSSVADQRLNPHRQGMAAGVVQVDEDTLPFEDPMVETVPTLAEMTSAALNVLGNSEEGEEGMFLMVEGGAVDWAGHANDTARSVEEQVDFNNSVEAAVEWVESESSWSETLVMVTADHETGYLVGPGSDPNWEPLGDTRAGEMPEVAWESGDHTNALVPMFAKGPGASRLLNFYANQEDPVRGPYISNVDAAEVVFDFWGGGPGRD